MEIEGLSRELYGMTKSEAITEHVCIACKEPPRFYSTAGYSEYLISGLCEYCFDKICGEEDMEVKQGNGMTDAQYDFETIASSQAYKDAETLGFEVVLPQDNQLQVDIDDEASYQVYLGNLGRYKLHFADNPVLFTEVKPSKSGEKGKQHITVTLADPISNEQRILIQALLGSDPVREMLSYIRLVNDDEHPTLFIEKPAQKQLKAPPEILMLGPGDFVEPADTGAY